MSIQVHDVIIVEFTELVEKVLQRFFGRYKSGLIEMRALEIKKKKIEIIESCRTKKVELMTEAEPNVNSIRQARCHTAELNSEHQACKRKGTYLARNRA